MPTRYLKGESWALGLDTALMGIAAFGVMVMVNNTLCNRQSRFASDIGFDSLFADAKEDVFAASWLGSSMWSVSVLAGFCINTVARARVFQAAGPMSGLVSELVYVGLSFACSLVVVYEQLGAVKRVAADLKTEGDAVLQTIAVSQYVGSTWMMYASLGTVTLVSSFWATMGLLFSHAVPLCHSKMRRKIVSCWLLIGAALLAYSFFVATYPIMMFLK